MISLRFWMRIVSCMIPMAAFLPDVAQAKPATGGIMQKGPDIEAAVRNEYARVQREGSREAFEIFIARHPGHPLVEDAQKQLRRSDLR